MAAQQITQQLVTKALWKLIHRKMANITTVMQRGDDDVIES